MKLNVFFVLARHFKFMLFTSLIHFSLANFQIFTNQFECVSGWVAMQLPNAGVFWNFTSKQYKFIHHNATIYLFLFFFLHRYLYTVKNNDLFWIVIKFGANLVLKINFNFFSSKLIFFFITHVPKKYFFFLLKFCFALIETTVNLNMLCTVKTYNQNQTKDQRRKKIARIE